MRKCDNKTQETLSAPVFSVPSEIKELDVMEYHPKCTVIESRAATYLLTKLR